MTGAPAVGSESGNGAELQPPLPDQAGEMTDPHTQPSAAAEPPQPDPVGDAQPADAEDRVAQLQAQLESLKAEHENLNGQYMRLAADFDNFRKRQSRDNDDLKLQIVCSTLGEILPVVDNFERARQQLNPEHEEAQSLHRSYQGLYKQLVDVFKQLGVSPMRVEGEPFDPNLHEAVMREESHDHPEDVIVAELQRGYHLNGRVLRHALVKVSMGPGPDQASDESMAPDPSSATSAEA
jgi:molecular chaperone GrpE